MINVLWSFLENPNKSEDLVCSLVYPKKTEVMTSRNAASEIEAVPLPKSGETAAQQRK